MFTPGRNRFLRLRRGASPHGLSVGRGAPARLPGGAGECEQPVPAGPATDHELPPIEDDGEHVYLTHDELAALADAAGE